MIPAHQLNYRISLTQANLSRGFLLNWGVPPPSLCVYKNYSTVVQQAGGGQSQHGFASVEIHWPVLTIKQAKVLRDFVDSAKNGTGELYFTVDLSTNGDYPWNSWADVKGKPSIPVITPTAYAEGLRIEDFTLTLNDISIVAYPATGV